MGGTVQPAGQVAQLVEHGIENAGVGGSSPPLPIDSICNESQDLEGIGINAGPFSVFDIEERSAMTTLELIASVMGLMSVWLTVRQSLWCWPAGLVMVVLYTWIFLDARLYADAGLQVVYVFLSIYGWIHWLRGGPRDTQLPVTTLGVRSRSVWFVAILTTSGGLGAVLSVYTDASFPYADAMIAGMSLSAQWLLARKKLESWWLWIAVDVLGICIFSLKGLYITGGLYAVFFILAVMGLRSWARSVQDPAVFSSESSCRPTPDISY